MLFRDIIAIIKEDGSNVNIVDDGKVYKENNLQQVLVHGEFLIFPDDFQPATDPIFGVVIDRTYVLKRTVKRLNWVQLANGTYIQDWTFENVDSTSFPPENQNPTDEFEFKNHTSYASPLMVGDFHLAPDEYMEPILGRWVLGSSILQPREIEPILDEEVKARTEVAAEMDHYTVFATAGSNETRIGDYWIEFAMKSVLEEKNPVTVLGTQFQSRFIPTYEDHVEVLLMQPGTLSFDEMYARAKAYVKEHPRDPSEMKAAKELTKEQREKFDKREKDKREKEDQTDRKPVPAETSHQPAGAEDPSINLSEGRKDSAPSVRGGTDSSSGSYMLKLGGFAIFAGCVVAALTASMRKKSVSTGAAETTSYEMVPVADADSALDDDDING